MYIALSHKSMLPALNLDVPSFLLLPEHLSSPPFVPYNFFSCVSAGPRSYHSPFILSSPVAAPAKFCHITMSLESLEICGIRGFSPDHSCKVDISSPLTIITGPTGSGKTAILEALRVAVTGLNVRKASKRIPPEINDPNTHARSETVASVRLVFQGADNVKYTVERQYKLKGASLTANTSGCFSSDPPKLTSSATLIHPDISMLPELLQSRTIWTKSQGWMGTAKFCTCFNTVCSR
ncbi:unnamed protein product [Chondrus crispus]|uniref:Rad50/SbcC-type AAA domain-containing protein n=1 Tax=Chondrus crispus TaxID=2769 RepID=R7QEN1_CHOCR|nr:unnamed protein product [Chondrus crispus]CDF36243.1 unnamed protein product [Chondrus crispus]|eukprot:XP_005716062.1 unnamed protein product [Chondrus crispus]